MKSIIIVAGLSFFTSGMAQAQIEELTANSRSAEQTQKTYRYTCEVQDTFRVMVIDPHGEMQTLPVRDKAMALSDQVEFDLDTKYWRDGTYRIIVQGAKGLVRSKTLQIRREKSSQR